MNIRNYMFAIFILVFLAGCTQGAPVVIDLSSPNDLNDGIEVGSIENINMDAHPIQEAIQLINEGIFGEIHAMLIYKNGKLVVEEYFSGHDYAWGQPGFHGNWVDWDAYTRHNVHSAGKSITAACIGIAIEKGFIGSVSDPISQYLPAYQPFFIDGKQHITIEHLLTMTSGLEWDEWSGSYADGNNDVIRLWLDCPDPIACTLEKPLTGEPGNTFTYNGGNMVLLGEIIRNASGLDIEQFSWRYLFEPLEISQPPWSWINGDVVYAGGDQYLTPREMLKFGILFLQNGAWKDEQILTPAWVQKSTNPFQGSENTWFNSFLKTIPPGEGTPGKRGYAYTWWTHQFRYKGKTIRAYFALGFGGQKIFVFPDERMVVVFTSGNYVFRDSTTGILTNFLFPALIS